MSAYLSPEEEREHLKKRDVPLRARGVAKEMFDHLFPAADACNSECIALTFSLRKIHLVCCTSNMSYTVSPFEKGWCLVALGTTERPPNALCTSEFCLWLKPNGTPVPYDANNLTPWND